MNRHRGTNTCVAVLIALVTHSLTAMAAGPEQISWRVYDPDGIVSQSHASAQIVYKQLHATGYVRLSDDFDPLRHSLRVTYRSPALVKPIVSSVDVPADRGVFLGGPFYSRRGLADSCWSVIRDFAVESGTPVNLAIDIESVERTEPPIITKSKTEPKLTFLSFRAGAGKPGTWEFVGTSTVRVKHVSSSVSMFSVQNRWTKSGEANLFVANDVQRVAMPGDMRTVQIVGVAIGQRIDRCE